MMKRTLYVAAITALVAPLAAQDTLPIVSQEIGNREILEGSAPVTIDLREIFAVSGVTGPVVQFESSEGTFNVEMFPTAAPGTVTNFLNYVDDGDFADSLVHRSAFTFVDNVAVPFVVQGGGFTFDGTYPVGNVPADPPIDNEFNQSNVRGTIAMAKSSDPDSATSQWFINMRDNVGLDDPGNSGGFTVFGRVIGSGMDVTDGIAALPRWNLDGGTFAEVPLSTTYTGAALPILSDWVIMSSIAQVPVYPEPEPSTSVLAFAVTANSNPGLITPIITHSELQVSAIPGQPGIATLTVTATDTNGNAAESSFTVEVTQTNRMRWLREHYTNGQIEAGVDTRDDLDTTGDGITNLLAYGFNLNPSQFHDNVLPAPYINGLGRLTIDFTRDTRADDLDYRVEAGPDPTSLQTIAQSIAGGAPTGSGAISETTGATTRAVTVSDTVDAGTTTARVLRLVVTRAAGQ